MATTRTTTLNLLLLCFSFLCVFISVDSLQVGARAKMVFSDVGVIAQLSGSISSHLIISPLSLPCISGSSVIFARNSNGTFQKTVLPPDLSSCGLAITNGKWFFASFGNWFQGYPYKFFSLDNNFNPKSIIDIQMEGFCQLSAFTGEDTLMAYFSERTGYSLKEFTYQNETDTWEKTLDVPAGQINLTQTSPLALPSFTGVYRYLTQSSNSKFFPTLLSKQIASDDWQLSAIFMPQDISVNEAFQYDDLSWFNGNDTMVFRTYFMTGWSSGKLYVAQYSRSNNTWLIVNEFAAEDFGLDNPYMVSFNSWANSVVWVNQDLALIMSHDFPTRFTATDRIYKGSVSVMFRDANGKWRPGGYIEPAYDFVDEANELHRVPYMTVSNGELVMVEVASRFVDDVNLSSYKLYTYPLCFQKPINVTCANDIPLIACDRNEISKLKNTYTIAEDNCGEVQVNIESIDVSSIDDLNERATVALQFERFGTQVAQCTASYTCPKPVVPIATTSGSDSVSFTSIYCFCTALVVVSLFV